VLDEPTSTTDNQNDQNDQTPVASAPDAGQGAQSPQVPEAEQPAPPAKTPRRRRATKAAAPAGDAAQGAAAQDETGSAGASSAAATAETDATAAADSTDETATADAVAAESSDAAPATPAKRVRKTPAKKAAPRKRATKASAADPASSAESEPSPPGQTGADGADAVAPGASQAQTTPNDTARADEPDGPPVADEPDTQPTQDEQDAVAQAVLAQADAPVVEPVEDQPSTARAVDDEAPVAALAPADEPPAPAKRTRARRTAAVTFQAPEPAPPSDEAPGEDAAEAPAPRRRRRAGTTGAAAPADLMPQLIEPVATEPEPAESAAEPEQDADDSDDDTDRPRRRRRRGGRGRGAARKSEDDGDTEGEGAAEGDEEAEASSDAPAAEGDEEATGTRRRRRRRRSTSSDDGDDDDASETPAPKTRSRSRSGATSADDDGVRGITGSTRMAAKRVRRQEGRDSGRKRAPLLSEAEFLARREAVERSMVVRQKGDRTQIAVLEDGVLVEHYVTLASAQSYAGNVYLGRVQNVLPSMEAAFVDIGKSRNAVLYAGEVNYSDVAGGRSRSIESVLKSGQEVLAQVSKDPIGHKGARLTGQVSLPGRYLVYVPEGSMTGISRKLPEGERDRLKKILKKVVPEGAGVIIRTAAEGASEEEIAGDVRRLQAQWEVITTKAAKGGAPTLLHAEPDLLIRVVRDVFNEDFTSLVVSGDSEWETIRDYVQFVAPDLAPRLSRHTSEKDVFAEHRIDEQLLKALDRKVHLPSGGSLVIDRTEAMVVVDVNTGKFVGKGGNLEETVTRNNLEAAEEIARQLRLRDIGGIIVVDFIDMVLESNRDLVVRRLVECLGRDRTKHQVAEVTSLGLVQMTRKRVGQGLLESFSEPCDCCSGRGVHVRPEPLDERRGDSADGSRARARTSKPLPADAPKPGAPIGKGAETPDQADDAPPAPRRRRAGRGSGAATVPAGDEMAELLADDMPLEPVPDSVLGDADVDETEPALVTPVLDPLAGADEAAVPPVVVPTDDVPAQPGGAVSADVVEAVQSGDVALVDTGDTPLEPGVETAQAPEPEPEPEPGPATEPEPAPRRRRRATSRPAGPPAATG